VVTELAAAAQSALDHGVARDSIVLDPGLGFSKRTQDSAAVLRGLDRILDLGFPVLVGPSRKRFVGELSGGVPPEDRLPGTIAACVAAMAKGAHIFRVHDVAECRRALDVAHALLSET
jgi:dihydropteroate synthase